MIRPKSREVTEPFEEAARRVYWDMAIYDKESMELLIKRVGADNVLFATEMFGAVNAIDPKTGRNFEDLVPPLQAAGLFTAIRKRRPADLSQEQLRRAEFPLVHARRVG